MGIHVCVPDAQTGPSMRSSQWRDALCIFDANIAAVRNSAGNASELAMYVAAVGIEAVFLGRLHGK